jgi:hypothetical protein
MKNILILLFVSAAFSVAARADDADERWQLRRLYVPVESLHAVMKQDRYGAILSREEFDELVHAARERDRQAGRRPRRPVVSSADYEARTDGERLVADVTVKLRAFSEFGDRLSFRIGGWNVENVGIEGVTVDVVPGVLDTIHLDEQTTASGLASSPSRNAAGSPGVMCTRLKLTNPTNMRTGMSSSNLRIKYRCTGEPLTYCSP